MSNSTHSRIKGICTMAVLISISIVLERFFSIRTPVVTIGFGFLPIMLAAILYGPLAGGIAGALADFLGAVLFPIGAFSPGFTLTAFLMGFLYGMLLHRSHRSVWRTAFAVVLTVLLGDFLLNTIWISVISGTGILPLLPVRIIKSALMIPVRFVAIRLMDHRIIDVYLVPKLQPALKSVQ